MMKIENVWKKIGSGYGSGGGSGGEDGGEGGDLRHGISYTRDRGNR